MTRRFLIALVFASITLALPLASASALDDALVIPAAAHAEGAAESFWTTDLAIHNAGPAELVGRATFVADGTVAGTAAPGADVVIPSRSTLALTDVVKSLFGLDAASGALSFAFDDAALPKLALSSRTYNRTFGQTIPALSTDDALAAGEVAVLFAPGDPAKLRLNFGAYAIAPSTVHWRLRNSDGSIAAEKTFVTYLASETARYNDGVRSLFGVEPSPAQLVEIEVVEGAIHAWASRVDNESNDGDYSLARRVRSNEPPVLLGLDTDKNGIADVVDADGDGTLDATVVVASAFPYEVRLIAHDPEGASLTWSGENLPTAVSLDSSTGELVLWGGAVLSATSQLVIHVSDGKDRVTVRIPVKSF